MDEDDFKREVLSELRWHREFVEDQAEAYQQQAQAEDEAFQKRKQARDTLERETIPDITASVAALEGGAKFDYFDLVKASYDLRAADKLYESIDWTFLDLQGALTDLRNRVKRLLTGFKDRQSPSTYLDCLDSLLQAANAVSWADDFYWDLDELSFSSPVDPEAAIKSWRSTTEKIETYANKLRELVKAFDVAKDLGLVAYREDQETIHFGNAALLQDALAALESSKSCSPSFEGDEGIKSLCWYLYIARSPESVLEHLASLYEKRDATYAALVNELEMQAGLIASLLDNPDSIEPALQNRPLRFAGIDLREEVPGSFLKKMRLRISNSLDARREKARAVAELARKTAAHLKQSFEDQAFQAHTQGKRTSDRNPIADVAANVAATGASPGLSHDSIHAQWEAIKKAAFDETVGREIVTLLGAMYQAKRHNSAEQLTLPTMVTSLPNDQQSLKNLLTVLFGITKNEDLSKIASRSQEIQSARQAAAKNRVARQAPG